MTINTDTHEIIARYSIENGIESQEITKNGYTIEEIITEMIEFANWMPGLATPFEVTSETCTGDGFVVTIEGRYFRVNEDGDLTDETDTMTITITGWKN